MQVQYLKFSPAWKDTETSNDVEKPVYIKKWSNWEDKLVFKLNAQVIESSHTSSDSEENWLKLLQIVKKDESEIVLKYNAGTADLIVNRNNIITADISPSCKKAIFSSRTSLKEKVHALESLFMEAKIKRIDGLINKYGGNKSVPRHNQPKCITYNSLTHLAASKMITSQYSYYDKSTRGQSSDKKSNSDYNFSKWTAQQPKTWKLST